MKFGIAGVHYGHFRMIVKDALQHDEVEVVGVAEADEALRGEWCETCACDGFDRIEDMLDRAEPDVVIEGSRIDEKADIVRRCADAGSHLILDKPLGLSLDELEAMAAAVRESGIELSMYFTLRYWPPFVGLKQVVDEGKLGKIVTMISTHPHKLTSVLQRPASMYERAAYPGTLCDIVCHGLDFCRWLTGAEPVRASATQGNVTLPDRPEFEDHVRSCFDLGDGSAAFITADWLWPDEAPSFGETRIIASGTKGTATLCAWAKNELEVALTGSGAEQVDLPKVELKQFVDDFVNAIKTGNAPPISNRDVFQTAHACLLARQSAESDGAPVSIPTMWE